MNRQYRDELDKVRLSAQSKQQLIDRLHEQSVPQTAKECGRKRRAVVLAVAACVVLAATAGAAVLHDTLQHLWTDASQPVYEAYKTDHVWKFEDVKLDYPTADTTYAVNKPVEYLGGTATLDEIMVSPFGVKVSISDGSAFHHHEENHTKDGDCLMCALTVYDADGNVLYENPQWGGAGSQCDEDAGTTVIYHDYQTADWDKVLIDPAKVAKVKVNNVEISLK